MDIQKDIDIRKLEESEEALAEAVPPADVVAFVESRSCADLFRLFKKQQLNLSPSFQRKIVWNDRAQTLFIDSLIKQLPIPSLCLCYDVRSQWRVVIDGLQRLYTIVKFLNYEESDWRLLKCADIDKRISGKYVSEICEKSPDVYCRLENLTLPITVIRCDMSKPSHMDYLFQIFRRLNSGGCRLLNQEIRNCIYQGPFNDYLHTMANSTEWMDAMRVSAKNVLEARYGNEERILRFHAMKSGWTRYSGNLSRFLNEYMRDNQKMEPGRIEALGGELKEVLSQVKRLPISVAMLRNKNLIEGVLVGIASNLSFIMTVDDDDFINRYERLIRTNPYSVDVKEGMAHTDKVKDRMREAVRAFGNNG